MQGRSKVIAMMIMVSLLLGLVVVMINPDYRDTARCMLSGRTEQSPIWIDNESHVFYPAVNLDRRGAEGEEAGHVAE